MRRLWRADYFSLAVERGKSEDIAREPEKRENQSPEGRATPLVKGIPLLLKISVPKHVRKQKDAGLERILRSGT